MSDALYDVQLSKVDSDTTLMSVRFGSPAAGDQVLLAANALLESLPLGGGRLLLIHGPMTLPIAFLIAHKVVHLFANVAVFDPKLNAYLVVANHGGAHRIGDLVGSRI